MTIMSIADVFSALANGLSVTRNDSNERSAEYFLESTNGKRRMFTRTHRNGVTLINPAIFDWDDIVATDWKVVQAS